MELVMRRVLTVLAGGLLLFPPARAVAGWLWRELHAGEDETPDE